MHSFSVKGVLFQKTERVISCNLDLAMKQRPQGISCDIFGKCSQPDYANIDMLFIASISFQYLWYCSVGCYQYSVLQVFEAL
jgi:hypothetical protein